MKHVFRDGYHMIFRYCIQFFHVPQTENAFCACQTIEQCGIKNKDNLCSLLNQCEMYMILKN